MTQRTVFEIVLFVVFWKLKCQHYLEYFQSFIDWYSYSLFKIRNWLFHFCFRFLRCCIILCKDLWHLRSSPKPKIFYSLFTRENDKNQWKPCKSRGGGETFISPAYLLQDMPIDFFDFQFIMNCDWTLKETKFQDKVLDPEIWSSLFLIKNKYFEKIIKLKKRTMMFEEKQKNYIEQQQARAKDKSHLKDHIRRSEAKLCEYKNTILAFWKLATCNQISK